MNKANECTCPSGDGSLVHPCPAHPAVEQAGGDRWDALQSIMEWTASENIPDERKLCLIRNAARAALAQPSPAQAEAERPEVAGYRSKESGMVYEQDYGLKNPEALTTVAECERIVGALRADRDSWAEQAEQRLADWDEMRKERDAAQARVAELEKQEPVALANRGNQAFWVKWTEAAAGLYGPGIKLYAAPVAQAQHSVPGDIMRDAQRYRWLRDQQFYFSFSTENSDAGISSCTAGMSSRFKNLSWVDAAIDSAIAAAPGKEGV